MALPTYSGIEHILRGMGLSFFDRGLRFNLNLVLLRVQPGTVDLFDDWLLVAYRDSSRNPQVARFACTADPGRPSLEHPKRRDGTAQLAFGQHRGAFTFGQHRGQYRCLVSTRDLPVVRYPNAEAFATGAGTPSTSATIQIHRAGLRSSERVGAWSEGCIVLHQDEDLDALLGLCDAQVAAGLGSIFSLTVIPWTLL